MGSRNYWGYYEPAKPIEVEEGIKTRSKRGEIGETWWSKRWIDILKSFNMGARLTRGRSYARRGQVISIDVEPGKVKAKVQGSRRRPYSVEMKLHPLSKTEWNKVTGVMASQAIFAAKLLAGEMPKNIEEAFNDVNISLFPASGDDLDTDCSCPDWANPCKHIAAVYTCWPRGSTRIRSLFSNSEEGTRRLLRGRSGKNVPECQVSEQARMPGEVIRPVPAKILYHLWRSAWIHSGTQGRGWKHFQFISRRWTWRTQCSGYWARHRSMSGGGTFRKSWKRPMRSRAGMPETKL